MLSCSKPCFKLWKELTFYMALVVLANNTSAILLVSWPFVDVHGGVGGACIQNNSILKETDKNKSHFNKYSEHLLSFCEQYTVSPLPVLPPKAADWGGKTDIVSGLERMWSACCLQVRWAKNYVFCNCHVHLLSRAGLITNTGASF